MNSFRSIFFKNLSLINLLTVLIFFIYSIIIIRYQYDGHHIGLIYSNSIDLLNGKLPYKEIFIQYGILTTIINSIILSIFDTKIFFISFFNTIFYFLGVLFISKTVNNFTNLKFSFLATVIILFNHPIPWLPWPNYIAFFFISMSFYLISLNNKNYFLIGFFLSLSILTRQDLFIPIIVSILIFSLIHFFFSRRIDIRNNFNFIYGFIIPKFIFLIYLFSQNIFDYWFNYLSLPKIYLDIYETNVYQLIFDYIIFFTSESFFSFIIFPQYFIISIILIFNSIFLFLFLFKKIKLQNEILFILIIGNLLSALSLKIELFRLYTSVIFGLISLLYIIHKIKDINFKKKFIMSLLLPSLFSICFYPLGNNHLFNKLNFSSNNLKIINNKFDYNIWPEQKIKIINTISDISTKCDVRYLENLTWDTLYSTISDYDRIKVMPYAQFKNKNFKQLDLVERTNSSELSFIQLINNEIVNSNIILLVTENNHIYKNEELIITSNYKMIEIDQNNIIGKPEILRIYFPEKCTI